ncbi:hypothetical protein BT93_G0799 [Corymbia citriodora subsp. variegata]|nr:hypothetical protein BT93_G0799 [Corymbia citriodora subsp. variegata]
MVNPALKGKGAGHNPAVGEPHRVIRTGEPSVLNAAGTSAAGQTPNLSPHLDGPPALATRTWANVAKAAMKGYSLSFYKPCSDGVNEVHCSDEDLDAADPIWHECLVGYLVGKKLPFKLVETALKHLWGHQLLEVKANDQGFFFFHISDSEFRRKVVEGGPLTVARVPLILQQWHPMLELKKGDHSSIPVWIRLKNLPYGLWSATGISKVASVVGRPLYVDQRTEHLKMISFARVCVELAATKTCCDTITVHLNGQTRVVDVEYEWKPVTCHRCGTFGHRCPDQVHGPPKAELGSIGTGQPSESPAGSNGQDPSLHGAPVTAALTRPPAATEWTQVSSKHKRSSGKNKQPATACPHSFDSADDLDED